MLVERGLNDAWTAPRAVIEVDTNTRRITLREPLNQQWDGDLVGWEVPAAPGLTPVAVIRDGADVPFQVTGRRLFVRVDNLGPGEQRTYDVRLAAPPPQEAPEPPGEVFGNGAVELRLPAPGDYAAADVPGPILGVREPGGEWLGSARMVDAPGSATVEVHTVETGILWTTVAVTYDFPGGHAYTVHLTLRPEDPAVEVYEASDLPVRLRPAPRPYHEIGTLGKSHWDKPLAELRRPCIRPRQRTNVVFQPTAGWQPDSIVTHSTSSWEIMHLPLASDAPAAYTVMRPCVPFIDGGWFGLYRRGGDRLLGVASLDLAHWRTPDITLHPKHRMPGATGEIVMLQDPGEAPRWLFPVENIERRWLLAVLPYRPPQRDDAPLRAEPDPAHPLWNLRRRRGDLCLDKVKDWVVEWPDAGHDHPRLLCRRDDFTAIRRRVEAVPEMRDNRDASIALHAADRWLLRGEAPGLAAVEDATHARELVEGILAKGYAGPTYAIGLGRPLRRYVMAGDIMWDSFTPEEKQEFRRVCALAAYIMTDGDWWQYAWKTGETTYLPNFDTDVFTAAGMIGMFLSDHPCAQLWNGYLTRRMDLELEHHLRLDGGGEENLGNYLPATWKQLYMPTLWALKHTGIRDFSADPRILAGARFLLCVLGPPDARDDGRRMLPPIGHHPNARKALTFGPWLAAFIGDADPELAGNLQWAWRATGAYVDRNQDHSGPTANPLTRHYVMHDPGIPEIEPDLGSHDLPNVGAVVRTHDASGQGGFLLLKAGRVHSHHDDDEGSFHWYARGVPLALDGLPLQNGATAAQHNAVSFARRGQPSGIVEVFSDLPAGAYIRALMPPGGYINDAMYLPDSHASGWVRELLLVKATEPGAIEYLVVKDTCLGPDACQWNLDVLSTRPEVAAGFAHFPGHGIFGMGLDVHVLNPEAAKIEVEEGIVNPVLLDPEKRAQVADKQLAWEPTAHWLMHIPAPAGSTFVAVLFPRRADENAARINWFARESSAVIEHDAGADIVFLRPSPTIPLSLDGAWFRGRAGLVRQRAGQRDCCPFDGVLTSGVGPEPDRV